MTGSVRIAAATIAVGSVVLALKAAAWAVTGSAALFSDAAETVVNVVAAVVTLAALLYASRPPDAGHPYGHDKAEFFAAIIEGALIVVAALVIVEHAWASFRHPVPLAAPWRGGLLNGVATLLNLGWAARLLRAGRQHRSPALVADGQHLLADAVASAGVLAGVALVVTTGRAWLDPLLALLVAMYVLISGVAVIYQSVGGLMDAAPSADIVARIRDLVASHAEGAIEAHDLRTRHAGRLTYLEFHLVVPGSMTVAHAHDICDRIESALRDEMEAMVITIHVEPEAKAKHHGVVVL